MKKAKFVKRMSAYIIDILLITIISSVLTSFIPLNNTAKQKQNRIVEISSSINDKNFDESLEELSDLNYYISKNTVIISLVNIIISIIYFIIYPMYNNGQTVGKKLLKIKINSYSGKLSMNNLMIRGIILYSIWCDLINLILIMILKKQSYLSASSILINLQSIITFIIIFMIIIRKDGRGLHDILGNTIVEEE